jgi:lipopolysaccharide heptosyltransferase I
MDASRLPDLREANRLLIIRLSSIGDVTHALPLSAALGDAFPHLELTWLVEEMSAPIVTGNPYLHDVIVIPRSRWKRGRLRSPAVWREFLQFGRDLRRRRFDVSLDVHGHAKSGLMALLAGAPHRLGWWDLRDGASLASRPLPKRPESAHRVDWFLDVARRLGAGAGEVRFPLFIPEEARLRARTLLEDAGIPPGAPFAVLTPAAGDMQRRWPVARYAELAGRLSRERSLPVVLVGSAKDTGPCERVRHLATKETVQETGAQPVVSVAGRTELKELAAVLEMSAFVVSGDTGSAHIAAALARPVIGLYGPTDPAHAGPWNQLANVISRRDVCTPDCTANRCAHGCPGASAARARGAMPASDVGPDAQDDECADAPARCMRTISVDDVMRNVDGWVQRART